MFFIVSSSSHLSYHFYRPLPIRSCPSFLPIWSREFLDPNFVPTRSRSSDVASSWASPDIPAEKRRSLVSARRCQTNLLNLKIIGNWGFNSGKTKCCRKRIYYFRVSEKPETSLLFRKDCIFYIQNTICFAQN